MGNSNLTDLSTVTDLSALSPEELETISSQAAAKWGPELVNARWNIENHFPGFSWMLSGVEPQAFSCSLIAPENANEFDAMSCTPEWAMCLAIEMAARAGFYKEIPPAPPPPPLPEKPQ